VPKKLRTNETSSASREPIPATKTQIEDLGLVVSAAWHGLKQGRNFLPHGFTYTIEGDVVSMKSTENEGTAMGRFDEVRLILNDGAGTTWTIQSVRVSPNIVDELPKGFLRHTTTYPLVEGSEVTKEIAVCKPDANNILQPVSEPTILNCGPITNVQVENLLHSITNLGAMGNTAT
jgi:hypothetical protein